MSLKTAGTFGEGGGRESFPPPISDLKLAVVEHFLDACSAADSRDSPQELNPCAGLPQDLKGDP